MDFSELKGETLIDIKIVNDDEILFFTQTGKKLRMHHWQQCCEQVSIKEITDGYQEILLNKEVLHAEESFNQENGDELWTFYKLSTINGTVDVAWYGSTNSCYTIGVDFDDVTSH